MRRLLLLLVVAGLVLPACGSSSGSSSKPTKTPDPNATRTATRTPKSTRTATRTGGPTRTPTRTGGPTDTPRPTRTPGPPVTLYVRISGSDENAGTAPSQALRTLGAAMKRLSPGSTLHVGSGVYAERLAVSDIVGTATLPVQILADRAGTQTGDRGDVVIDGNGELASIVVTSSPYLTIDGFILRGAAPTASTSAVNLRIRGGSDHVTIRNCVVANAQPADGIRVDNSNDVLLFNNLVFSADRGIIVTGSSNRVSLINDTIALSDRAALSIRASGGSTPRNVSATNCIVQENGTGAAIDAPGTNGAYTGDYNLVYQPGAANQTTAYDPTTLRGRHDLNVDAQFVNVGVGDVHLEPHSPAIDAGSGRIDDALKTALGDRSTTADGARDRSPLDLGYHYPR
ncbi:right-handed parallel beta-helix repeat-containing protein [bacterium]|nr:right-handed parallel beta-helix repeat-containing protein [bacterium]